MTTLTESPATHIRIAVTDRSNVKREYVVPNGSTVMVGSGANCGVRLPDHDVRSIHCVLRFSEHSVDVQDWCTPMGTFINGDRVHDETVAGLDCEINIGQFKLTLTPENGPVAGAKSTCGSGCRPAVDTKATAARAEAATPATKPSSAAPPVAPVAPSSVAPPTPTPPPAAPPPAATPVTTATVIPSAAQTVAVVTPAAAPSVAPPPVAPVVVTPVAPPPQAAAPKPATKSSPTPVRAETTVDAETVRLLQAEIECLQCELAERDRQLEEFAQWADHDTPHAAAPSDSVEVERLVNRLESLLEELGRNDQRIQALEELLRVEQDVARHQDEEREEMEKWLKEIEVRVSAHEAEWNAEKDVLSRRIESLRTERDRANHSLTNASNASQTDEVVAARVVSLQQELDHAKEALEVTERQRQALETELEQAKQQRSPEQLTREQIEAAVREERLSLAQERASLSRERAEIARGHANSTEPVIHERLRPESDERFQAFRQTLKEIHRQEGTGERTTKKPSLATRIADLWRKLDGPTDTD